MKLETLIYIATASVALAGVTAIAIIYATLFSVVLS